VESQPGTGSCFSFELVLERAPAAAPASSEAEADKASEQHDA
jgi:hypothetical protein